MNYYGIMMLIVFILEQCGIKTVFTHEMKQDMLLNEILIKNSLKSSIRVNLLKEVLY